MRTSKTFTATIYCGLCPGHDGDFDPGEDWTREKLNEAKDICRAYCDNVGLCVTIERTMFVYSSGSEIGFKVGFINYPRFPKYKDQIKQEATKLASILRKNFKQKRVSVEFSDVTIMLED